MSKLSAVKTLFEIGKIAAETYETYIDAQHTIQEMTAAAIEKEKEISKLKEENEKLKKKLKDKGIDID